MTVSTKVIPGTAGLDILDPAVQQRLFRRSLAVVVASQILGGAGLAAGVTVGALLAEDMLGGQTVAGLPSAALTLGSAGAAFAVGRASQRVGRRLGLGGGFLAGAVGATGIVIAAVIANPVLLFVSLFVYGAGTATNLQARYAGTDLAPLHRRATAVSIALVATTVGAVAGPNSVDALGGLAERLGLPTLSGPFLLAAVAYALAGTLLLIFLRPDPLLVARQIATAEEALATPPATPGAAGSGPTAADHLTHEATHLEPEVESPRGIALGATVMVLTQIAMVAIMTMTPVQMREHHHTLGEVGFVIGMHIGAMYLPSLITGPLVDTVGRVPMVIAAAVTLVAAGVLAAVAPGESLWMLTLALVLLGLGWNFGLISGTALIVDSTMPSTRAQKQGSIDVLIALAGAGGGALSGLVMGMTNYAVLSLAGGALAVLLIPVVAWERRAPGAPA